VVAHRFVNFAPTGVHAHIYQGHSFPGLVPITLHLIDTHHTYHLGLLGIRHAIAVKVVSSTVLRAFHQSASWCMIGGSIDITLARSASRPGHHPVIVYLKHLQQKVGPIDQPPGCAAHLQHVEGSLGGNRSGIVAPEV
jgi:hypothetical protein